LAAGDCRGMYILTTMMATCCRCSLKEGVELAHDTPHRMVQRVARDAEEPNAIGDRASRLALRAVTSETSTVPGPEILSGSSSGESGDCRCRRGVALQTFQQVTDSAYAHLGFESRVHRC
jgi:hypothetical protein